MTNTIVSTLSSSIGFIQLKLSDYDQKEIDFDKIINRRFKNVETPPNVYQKLELLENNHCYDEQYVKIKGVWMYRLTLFDHILNIPVNEKITPDTEYTTIIQFIRESTKNKPLKAITTDHVPEYKNIMDELKVKHQLYIFHFYKMIGDKLYTLLRSKKVSEDEKIRLKRSEEHTSELQ